MSGGIGGVSLVTLRIVLLRFPNFLWIEILAKTPEVAAASLTQRAAMIVLEIISRM